MGDRVGECDGPVFAHDLDALELLEGAGRVLGGGVPDLVDSDGDVVDSGEASEVRSLADVFLELEDVQAFLFEGVLQNHFELRGRGVRGAVGL